MDSRCLVWPMQELLGVPEVTLRVTKINPKTKTVTLSGTVVPSKGDMLAISPDDPAQITLRPSTVSYGISMVNWAQSDIEERLTPENARWVIRAFMAAHPQMDTRSFCGLELAREGDPGVA